MIDLIPYTLFGSAIGFGITFLCLLFVLFVSDLEECGRFATFGAIVFIIFVYFWGDSSFFEIFSWRNVGIYLFVGKLFALLRTYFKGKELSKSQKKDFDLRGNYFRWWLLFPISAVNWVFGKLLKDLYNFVYGKFESFIVKIFNA